MWRPWLFTSSLPVIAGCIYPWVGIGQDLSNLTFICAFLSLACVTGIWLGMANRWWRFLVAPFAITLTAFALGYSGGNRFDWTGASITAITSVVIWFTLEITKLISGRFEIPDSRENMSDGLQFGISQLMIATAVIALFISGVKLLIRLVDTNYGSAPPSIYWIAGMFVSILVLFTLTGMWALLGRTIGYKLVVAAFVSIVAAVAAPWVIMVGTLDDLLWAGQLFGVCWIAITLQLWLIRIEGMRFVRK